MFSPRAELRGESTECERDARRPSVSTLPLRRLSASASAPPLRLRLGGSRGASLRSSGPIAAPPASDARCFFSNRNKAISPLQRPFSFSDGLGGPPPPCGERRPEFLPPPACGSAVAGGSPRLGTDTGATSSLGASGALPSPSLLLLLPPPLLLPKSPWLLLLLLPPLLLLPLPAPVAAAPGASDRSMSADPRCCCFVPKLGVPAPAAASARRLARSSCSGAVRGVGSSELWNLPCFRDLSRFGDAAPAEWKSGISGAPP